MRTLFYTHAVVLLSLACELCPAQTATNEKKLEFEVATTKFNISQSPVGYAPGVKDGRFRAINMPLRQLLAYAYDVKDFQISGPASLDTNTYDIQAIVPEGSTRDHVALMLRNLLEDRLKITTHHEAKETTVFHLVVAKGGAKLQLFVPGITVPRHIPDGSQIMGTDGDLPHLGELLAQRLSRPVVDKTGITGKYSILIVYDDGHGNGTAPGLVTALEEQLGLRLESAKEPMDLLVVDHAEKLPEAN